jgi:hypothetical protein
MVVIALWMETIVLVVDWVITIVRPSFLPSFPL